MSQSLELEVFIEPDPTASYSEAFSLHPPDEPPSTFVEDIFEFVGGKYFEVLITPSVIRADESLKTLSLTDRMCYLEGEKKLQMFKIYTSHNCDMERFHNMATDHVCTCLPFSFPRKSDTRVCGIKPYDLACARNFVEEFQMFNQFEDFGIHDFSCLPPCDSVRYDIEIRESKLRGHE